MSSGSHDLLDSENRQRAERLQSKVTQLKSFAVDIERETKEHNRLLDDSSLSFDTLFGLMGNGRNRLNRLLHSNRGNRKLMCYFALSLTIFLLIVYFLITGVLFREQIP